MNNKQILKKLNKVRLKYGIGRKKFASKKILKSHYNFIPWGYADCHDREIAINPDLYGHDRISTEIHELAHILLNHRHIKLNSSLYHCQEIEAIGVEHYVCERLGIIKYHVSDLRTHRKKIKEYNEDHQPNKFEIKRVKELIWNEIKE